MSSATIKKSRATDAAATSHEDVLVVNLHPVTNVMIWLLVVSGLYAAFVVGAMPLGTLVWFEAAALVLGLVALAFRKTSRPVHAS